MEMAVENIIQPFVKKDPCLTEYHYAQNQKLCQSIKRLSRLPTSFDEARRIANKQQMIQ